MILKRMWSGSRCTKIGVTAHNSPLAIDAMGLLPDCLKSALRQKDSWSLIVRPIPFSALPKLPASVSTTDKTIKATVKGARPATGCCHRRRISIRFFRSRGAFAPPPADESSPPPARHSDTDCPEGRIETAPDALASSRQFSSRTQIAHSSVSCSACRVNPVSDEKGCRAVERRAGS